MQRIFKEYGGVITTVIAIVALIGIISLMLTPPNGWISIAFGEIIDGFNAKATQAITGEIDSDGNNGLELDASNGVVPDGWIYTQITDGTKLYPGDKLPDAYVTGDTMEDNDYVYTLSNPLDSYGCKDLDEFKALILAETGMSWTEFLAASGMTEEQALEQLTIQWSVIVKETTKEAYGTVYSKLLGYPVTYMGGTFEGCTELKVAPEISQNATYMHTTFKDCTSLTSAPSIPASVTNMYHTFWNCSSLKTPPDMSKAANVVNMEGTFRECIALASMPNLSKATKVENMKMAFDGCKELKTTTSIPESVTNMLSTFSGCEALTVAPTIPKNVTDIDHTFNGCTALTTAPTILANVTSMDSTFMDCTSLKTYAGSTKTDGDFTGYVLPETITIMQYAFWNCDSITISPALPGNVENIRSTFNSCAALTTAPVIPASVKNMYGTFSHCTELTGTVTVNANPSSYTDCFYLTKITDIAGSTTMKDQLLNTID